MIQFIKFLFFIYGINGAKIHKERFSDFPYISHYQIGKLVSFLIGYEVKERIFNQKEDYFVCDSDISGLAGILKLSFDNENKQIPVLMK